MEEYKNSGVNAPTMLYDKLFDKPEFEGCWGKEWRCLLWVCTFETAPFLCLCDLLPDLRKFNGGEIDPFCADAEMLFAEVFDNGIVMHMAK